MTTQAEKIIALLSERGPVEPVCPDGVTAFTNGDTWVRPNGHHIGGVSVGIDGAMRLAGSHSTTPACLRYAADLSEYRADLHAASDRQRKLDAVRAAEAEAERMIDARDTAHRRFLDADNLRAKAELALATARREAGL